MELPHALDFPKRLVQQAIEDEVPDLAAGLAYRFLFAVFPFGIFLAALAGFIAPVFGVGDPTNDIIRGLGDNLPPDVAAQLAPQLEEVLGKARPGLLSVGALAALWAANGGISSLISAMNKAYDVDETRSFFHKLAVALALTILGSAGILVAFVTLVGGSVITEEAVKALDVSGTTWTVISLLRFPLVLLLVAVAVAALFRFGPNVRVSFRWTLLGGVAFAIAWVVATVVFGLYVANFGSYANTYGALGGVVVLMLWFYLTALMLLLAAEVTSLLAADHEPSTLDARRAETGAHGAARAAKKAGSEGLDPDVPDAADPTGAAGPTGVAGPGSSRAPAPSAPAPSAPAPGYAPPVVGPRQVLALVFLAGAAVVGAIAGLLPGGDDDRGGAASS